MQRFSARWLSFAALFALAAGRLSAQDAAGGDWTTDAPGIRHKVSLEHLPPPFATKSAGNGPHIIRHPDGATLRVPEGFVVEPYAEGFKNPRKLVTAPNGDIFVVESGPGTIRVLRGGEGQGRPETNEVFADDGMKKPFGAAFYPPGPDPQFLYIANTDSVVRFPYHNGDLKAAGPAESLGVTLSSGGLLTGGGHWTRDLAFSHDGQRMFVSIGSKSNVDEGNNPEENQRARIFEFKPDGTDQTVYASGIRNAVGIAVRPGTDAELWMSTNERDGLGDDLVPDYISHVTQGGFYGWPWFFMGNHPDPRKNGEHPELGPRTLTPDVPLQSHSATLNILFYTGKQFPATYRGRAFTAIHGSWNRTTRTGYKIVSVKVDENGKTDGSYEDFLTGFVVDNDRVWGRPVGLTVAHDGSLLFSEDGNNTLWRVRYAGK